MNSMTEWREQRKESELDIRIGSIPSEQQRGKKKNPKKMNRALANYGIMINFCHWNHSRGETRLSLRKY